MALAYLECNGVTGHTVYTKAPAKRKGPLSQCGSTREKGLGSCCLRALRFGCRPREAGIPTSQSYQRTTASKRLARIPPGELEALGRVSKHISVN